MPGFAPSSLLGYGRWQDQEEHGAARRAALCAALYCHSEMWRRAIAILPLSLWPICCLGGPPQGIPREFARQRALQISDLRYHLSFVLAPQAPTTTGSEEIRFKLHGLGPVLLDFRDGTLTTLSVNGAPVPVNPENGHLELPANTLRAGDNEVNIQFVSQIAPAGKPLTRFEDHDDNTEYIYSLFVPMDASMAFPCFDQPDLKGRFQLEITAPKDWTIISNTAEEDSSPVSPQQRHTTFAETPPISTYLLAFAAGPFRKIVGPAGLPGLYVRQSKLERAQAEATEGQQIAARGMEYLAKFFSQPFPFPKYDMVLIPGLAYGGMEHAGATFLREESVLFRTAPTRTDQADRDILVLHELTHQWFGNLVTMRWFDDLWLKEGFAQYMAYETLASLKPEENVWKRFHESIKPAAYAIDSTKGTTPIYQEIPNLQDAKSAYGAIVYSKAPAMLKQLAFVLGSERFRDGLRLYLKEHAYANAEWKDLVDAFERVSGERLSNWAEMWIEHRGMPQVDVHWSCQGDRLSRLSLEQHDVLGTNAAWPMAMQLVLIYDDGREELARFDLMRRVADVTPVAGRACPAFVFANDQDYAYGRFLLDARSRGRVLAQMGAMQNLFRRTLLWGSLWDSVRAANLAPRDYIEFAAKLLQGETDESLTRSILFHVATALHRYMSTARRSQFAPVFETLAADRMMHSPDQDLRIVWFRGLQGLAGTTAGLGKLKALLDGQILLPGVELRPLDRWNLVAALMALGDPEAEGIFNSERQRDSSGEEQKYAYFAEAARPDGTVKRTYFEDYLHNASRPEDWIEQSLGSFNYWNQSGLTAPYLKPALEALPQIKRERKIFFLVDWLTAFVDGQQSPAAQAQVHAYLRRGRLDKDLQLKVLQAVDELDRTVAIRQKFPE